MCTDMEIQGLFFSARFSSDIINFTHKISLNIELSYIGLWIEFDINPAVDLIVRFTYQLYVFRNNIPIVPRPLSIINSKDTKVLLLPSLEDIVHSLCRMPIQGAAMPPYIRKRLDRSGEGFLDWNYEGPRVTHDDGILIVHCTDFIPRSAVRIIRAPPERPEARCFVC